MSVLMVYLNICVVFQGQMMYTSTNVYVYFFFRPEIVRLQRHNNSVPISTFMWLWAFIDRSAYSAAVKYVDRSWEYIWIAHRHMNVDIGTAAAQFLFWEYINGIFVAEYFCNIWALSKNKLYNFKIKYYASRPKS